MHLLGSDLEKNKKTTKSRGPDPSWNEVFFTVGISRENLDITLTILLYQRCWSVDEVVFRGKTLVGEIQEDIAKCLQDNPELTGKYDRLL